MSKVKELFNKYQVLAYIVLLALLCVVPFALPKAVYVRYACNILMYATLAGSLNIINGYSGQTCLGQAGFFAIGAYTMGALSTKFGISFWLLLPLAGILAAFVGFLVSLPTLKLKGIYLSIVTLGASEIIRIIAQTWTPVTGGAMGIKQIPYPEMFGLDTFRPKYYYFIFLFIGVIFLFVTKRVLQSRVGRAWISIREDEIAAKSLGVQTSFYKSLNFMYGAFWAGVVGCAYAPFVNYIEASQFSTDTGFNVLAMIVIGGQGTLIGPIVGSTIVTLLTESLRFLESWRYVIYAVLIIAMMWLRPQGIAGASRSILAGGKIKRKKQAAGAEGGATNG
ncbi:MAG: branched-chain amino acid ABC transporter permease [Christensenellaceae bacterium]|nr:branched-chain amino acid ABC transporter permease [Christensenellaceae bacterium]